MKEHELRVPTHSYSPRWLVGLALLTHWDHERTILIECHRFPNYLRDSVIMGLVEVFLHSEWYCARLAESERGGGGVTPGLNLTFMLYSFRHPSSGFHRYGNSLQLCRHDSRRCWWLRILRNYDVHVHLHWVVLDCQLEGVAGVGIKDIQLVGDSKWQDL